MQIIQDAAAHETLCQDQTRAGSLKRNFLRAQANLLNFVPNTARGNFDARLDMTAQRLTVTVRLHCNFVVDGGSTLTNWWGPLEKSTFKEEFQTAVNAAWNNRARFVCTKRGWSDIAVTPHFEVAFEGEAGRANFLANINRDFEAYGPGGLLKCGGAFVGLQQITQQNPLAQSSATFQAFNPRTVTLGVTRSGVAQRERERIEALLVNIAFAAGSADLTPTSLLALATLSRNIAGARTPNAPRTPIILTGDVAGGEAAPLAQQRAAAVQVWLQGQNLGNPLQVAVANPSQNQSRVVLSCDRNYENNLPDWNYNISAHEFGHLIGLPDEYEDVQGVANPATNPKRVQRVGFDTLVQRAHVRAPDFGNNRTTTSIMSFGMDILPCHLVTVWEALGQISQPFVAPGEWRIATH